MPISARHVVMTAFDHRRLEGLVTLLRARAGHDEATLSVLDQALERAEIVPPDAIPADIVTMNSKVELLDLETGQTLCVTLVFPGTSDESLERISVLSPLGVALLGRRELEELTDRDGRRLRVIQILYQPEAVGDFAV